MGTYAVTGGSKGIGEKTVEILRANGHAVINVDITGGDINVDLGTPEGREAAVGALHERCPEGLDGLVSNAGIAGLERFKNSRVLAVNYFGAVAMMEGVYDLLKLKKGSCVVTVSGAVAYNARGKYCVDALLTNCGDETRIARFADTLDAYDIGNFMYISTKMALIRWTRRTAPNWAAHGVNLNAVAPGPVATSIMEGNPPKAIVDAGFYLPMPTRFGKPGIMAPDEIAEALAFLVQPGGRAAAAPCSFATLAQQGSLIWRKFIETRKVMAETFAHHCLCSTTLKISYHNLGFARLSCFGVVDNDKKISMGMVCS